MDSLLGSEREFARANSQELAVKRQDRSFSSLSAFVGAAIVGLALLVSPADSNAQTFYVAKNGSDNNPGTLSAPFATFGRAQAAMRGSAVKTVTIRGGTYSLAGSSLTFNAADTGETWIPFQTETVVLDGGGSGYIWTNTANNLTIEGLTFENLGPFPFAANGTGISGMVVGGSGLTIRWNRFLNCYEDCISGWLSYSVIDSNTFDGQFPGHPPNGQYSFAYAAIQLWSGPNNNQITHNLIQNMQGGGIS